MGGEKKKRLLHFQVDVLKSLVPFNPVSATARSHLARRAGAKVASPLVFNKT